MPELKAPAPEEPAKSAPSEEAGKSVPPLPPPGAPAPEAAMTTADWESRFKYLLADFENFRKRADRDRDSIRRRAEADVLRSLLPIQDSVERARQFVSDVPSSDPVRRGFDLLGREWDALLKRHGIVPVASVGRPFDPDDQEVVGEAPPSPGHPPGSVLEVVQQGYRFAGGLLRPAKVLVARAPPPPPEPTLPHAPPREDVPDAGPSE